MQLGRLGIVLKRGTKGVDLFIHEFECLLDFFPVAVLFAFVVKEVKSIVGIAHETVEFNFVDLSIHFNVQLREGTAKLLADLADFCVELQLYFVDVDV